MHIFVHLVNAFTSLGEGGNPAGVVLQEEPLSAHERQVIADKVGCPETVFVTLDEGNIQLRFHTPTNEVDFCGHATLAAFFTLHEKGLIGRGSFTSATNAGDIPVTIDPLGMIEMRQQPAKILRHFSYEEVEALTNLSAEDLASTQLPCIAMSTGLPDLLLPVPKGSLDRLLPRREAIRDFCQQHNLIGVHAFELHPLSDSVTATCRNFAPLYGIDEEAATGSSCGALACYLAEHLRYRGKVIFEQGHMLHSRSRIHASAQPFSESKADTPATWQVSVGGFANAVGSLHISV